MALGEPYEEYTRVFHYASHAVSGDSSSDAFLALALILLAFVSLALALLGDKKTQSSLYYLAYSLVASLSIGLGSIYVSNTVGVYI
ncbi:hypothetical protein ABC855_g792 [[Candida] zeylanoides]